MENVKSQPQQGYGDGDVVRRLRGTGWWLKGCWGCRAAPEQNNQHIPSLMKKTHLFHQRSYLFMLKTHGPCCYLHNKSKTTGKKKKTTTTKQYVVSWVLSTAWPFVPGEDSRWMELIWLRSPAIYLGQSYLICGCQTLAPRRNKRSGNLVKSPFCLVL